MPPSWLRRRSTYLRGSALSDAQPKRIQLHRRARNRRKAIGRVIEIGAEIGKVSADEASIVAIEVIGATADAPSIGAIVELEAIAGIEVTVDARSIVDVPTAAVVRDVIAIARERTERAFPPGWWLG